MSMEGIRRAAKKYKWLIGALVVLMVVGMVVSFSVWSDTDLAGNDFDKLPTKEKIARYEAALESYLPRNPEDIDLELATTLGDINMGLSSFYAAYAQEHKDDTERYEEYMQKFREHATEAITYFQQSLSLAEEGQLTDTERASYFSAQGLLNYSLGNYEESCKLYQEALSLTPSNYSVAINYSLALNASQGAQAALEYLQQFRLGIPSTETEAITELESYIAQYQAWIDMETSDDTATGEESNQ